MIPYRKLSVHHRYRSIFITVAIYLVGLGFSQYFFPDVIYQQGEVSIGVQLTSLSDHSRYPVGQPFLRRVFSP